MQKLLFIGTMLTLLSACAATEIPNNDQPGADQMKISPCACQEIPYKPIFNKKELS